MPSSVIEFFHYEEQTHRLVVGFLSGKRYVYLGVPPEVFDRMKSFQSKGKFLNLHIKGKFPFEKLTPDKRKT